ncbi:hypothetical protein FF38_06526 [Lucilia cuprina]|uniref:Uncharacterized protein n=1 Tax=Lucilia cuprina TaxID=7375 RepID=A0A0L0C5A3_LUCCU|nr:hypothetical protein FF38_06526 [Lucilia cuprina]
MSISKEAPNKRRKSRKRAAVLLRFCQKKTPNDLCFAVYNAGNSTAKIPIFRQSKAEDLVNNTIVDQAIASKAKQPIESVRFELNQVIWVLTTSTTWIPKKPQPTDQPGYSPADNWPPVVQDYVVFCFVLFSIYARTRQGNKLSTPIYTPGRPQVLEALIYPRIAMHHDVTLIKKTYPGRKRQM